MTQRTSVSEGTGGNVNGQAHHARSQGEGRSSQGGSRSRPRGRSGQPSRGRSRANMPGREARRPVELPDADAEILDVELYREMEMRDLIAAVQAIGIELDVRPTRDALLRALMLKRGVEGWQIKVKGILQVLPDRYGFLRSIHNSMASSDSDVFVSPAVIQKGRLQPGHEVEGILQVPREDDKFGALARVDAIDGTPIANYRTPIDFDDLVPEFPSKRLKLERGNGTSEDISNRIIDLVSPIGKGQRGLIVSPPKAGKTFIIQGIANAIARNNPEVALMVLLVDERPEEVTDMSRTIRGEVISSTFDENPARHLQVAEMTLNRAKRMVEAGRDVVIMLDSITRLARAYNAQQPASGKILSGGVDANALERPKRFFGAARATEGGGSLTIIASALVDTGSKMDEVIFEEFKGTGNMELHLERRIAEKRVFPAINIARSGTRREELLMSDAELSLCWVMRRALHQRDAIDAIEFLVEKFSNLETNEEFFNSMRTK